MKFIQASLLSAALARLNGITVATSPSSSATPPPSSSSSSSSSAYCVPHTVSTWEQESIFATFVNQFYIQKDLSGAIHTYVAETYIQHNPFIGQGPAATLGYLSTIWPGLTFSIQRLAFDNGLGWVHVKVTGLGPLPTAIVDIYRFNGSCVQEHWDVIEALPANATNPLALF